MRYEYYVRKITEALEKYKKEVDALEKTYLLEKQKVENYAKDMSGKWTEEYIEKYCMENNPNYKYKNQLSETRKSTEPVVLHYIEMLKGTIDRYFNAPVKTDFANKITTIKLSGLQLSDLEFKVLQDSATSYMERRLLNQLAVSRTTDNGVMVQNAETGETEYKKVSNPYLQLELPNIEDTYNAFNKYTQYAKGLLYEYAGEYAKLAHLLDTETPEYVAINMDAYLKCEADKEFKKVMEKANSILPESKIKRELTENDKRFIDTLIDPKYPNLEKEKVKKLAECDTDIETLLLLDERYRGFLEE